MMPLKWTDREVDRQIDRQTDRLTEQCKIPKTEAVTPHFTYTAFCCPTFLHQDGTLGKMNTRARAHTHTHTHTHIISLQRILLSRIFGRMKNFHVS